MRVIFDTPYQKYTEAEEVDVAGTSIRSVLGALFNRFPQLYVAVAEGELSKRTAVIIDDEEFLSIETVGGEAATLHFLAIIPAGADPVSIGTFIGETIAYYAAAGSALETIGVAIANSAILAGVVGSIAVTGLMVALQFAMGALSGNLSIPDAGGGLDNSTVYTFEGIRNTTASGTAIPIIYGTHRTGGMILNIFTKSIDTDTEKSIDATEIVSATELYYHLGLCEGEVEAITDVEIDKMPYTFYNAVQFEGRYGEETQGIIQDFNEITDTITVNRKVIETAEPIKYEELASTFGDYLTIPGYVDDAYHYANRLVLGPYTVEWVDDPVSSSGGDGGGDGGGL
ncbi:hypothetical protein [Geobacter sp. SVR]|uniref:hypothetical protein n=1 Tax=Geobacter sp. SVR TaxID=2495594 RepID=UPI00143EF915|nr:hypothetical protein [Geobacter sp. SVR]BCS54046.1 hypothetical protein GSVR_23540 [Geobacter sp. SVR]GCF86173.1 hypothetical protein GSbR_27730 [Geobacter sp. SVR]